MEIVVNDKERINKELLSADQFRKLRRYEIHLDALYFELGMLFSYPPLALEFNGVTPELLSTVNRLRDEGHNLLRREIPEIFEPFREVECLHPIKIARHYAMESQFNKRIAFKLWQRDNPWYELTDPDDHYLGH